MKPEYLSSKIFCRKVEFTWLKFFVIMLGAAGCLGVLVISRGNEAERYYFIRQLCWFLVSSLVLIVVSTANFEFTEKTAWILYVFGLLVLLLVLLCGVRINGMKGWFQLYSIGIQPSELLKPVFILVFARFWSGEKLMPVKLSGLLLSLILLAVWLILILLQPDAGTALIYCLVFLSMIWAGGAGTGQLLLTGVSFLPVACLTVLRYPYMRRRLEAFFISSPEMLQGTGWHAWVMAKSLQDGGWFGKLFNPDPTLNRVPYRSNDSIFAVLSEQLGFIGMLPLIVLAFCWLAFCCSRAIRSRSGYHQLVYVGCGVMLSGQAMLHLAVNLGVFPTTGVTFPLISYGGSSLLATMIIAGMADHFSLQEKNCIRKIFTSGKKESCNRSRVSRGGENDGAG